MSKIDESYGNSNSNGNSSLLESSTTASTAPTVSRSPHTRPSASPGGRVPSASASGGGRENVFTRLTDTKNYTGAQKARLRQQHGGRLKTQADGSGGGSSSSSSSQTPSVFQRLTDPSKFTGTQKRRAQGTVSDSQQERRARLLSVQDSLKNLDSLIKGLPKRVAGPPGSNTHGESSAGMGLEVGEEVRVTEVLKENGGSYSGLNR